MFASASYLHRLSGLVRPWQVPLAVFFTLWVVVYPATYLVGSLPGHRPATPVFVAADPASITTFAAWPSIRYIHGLLGATWTAAAPLQLSSRLRKAHPHLHRWSGRIMLAGSVCIMAGYLLMECGHVTVMQQHGPHALTFYRPVALWFTWTAAAAAHAAWSRAWAAHAAWAVRHIGAGLVFAAGRALVVVAGAACHATGLLDMSAHSNKMAVFYCCCYTSAALCVGGSELAVWRAARPSCSSSKGAPPAQRRR